MRSSADWSAVSATMSFAPAGTAFLLPCERLSQTMTSQPLATSCEVTTLPMYPAPPVTRTRSAIWLYPFAASEFELVRKPKGLHQESSGSASVHLRYVFYYGANRREFV